MKKRQDAQQARQAPQGEPFERTALQLRWSQLLQRIATHCRSSGGRATLMELRPETTLDAARERMARTAEAQRLLERGTPLPSRALPEVAETLDQLASGGLLQPSQLAAWRDTLALAAAISAHVAAEAAGEAQSEGGALRRWLPFPQALEPVLQRLIEALGPPGASPPQNSGAKRDGSSVTARPHAKSDGSTTALQQQLRAHLDPLRAALETCYRADVLQAIALGGQAMQAHALPAVAEPVLHLREARSPLLALEGQRVMAQDIRLAAGLGLVVSGAHNSGKTELLRLAGQLAWMARSGLPLPARSDSKIGLFPTLLVELDSDNAGGGSFSEHMQRLAEIQILSQSGSLVLLDNPVSRTDPEEGAEVAEALVGDLLGRSAAVVVATHSPRLKRFASEEPRLANVALALNAATLAPTFQLEVGGWRGSDTWRLTRSSGLQLPDPAGADPTGVASAQESNPQPAAAKAAPGATSPSAAAPGADNADPDELRRELAVELAAARSVRRELERDRTRVLTQQRQTLAREMQQVLDDVKRARERLSEAESHLQRHERQGLREAERALNELAGQVAIGGALRLAAEPPRERSEGESRVAPASLRWESLALGTEVRHRKLGKPGRVVGKPKRGQVTVQLGQLSTTVSIDALDAMDKAPSGSAAGGPRGKIKSRKSCARPATASSAPPTETGVGTAERVPERVDDNTCNLRGQRVEEALVELDQFLEGLARRGHQAGYVLHGHGTGALKTAVRAHLRRHRGVAHSAAAPRETGGDAYTLFWLLDP